MKNYTEEIKKLRDKLFNILPLWFKESKYSRYIFQAALSTVFYLIFSTLVGFGLALLIIISFAIGVLFESQKIESRKYTEALTTVVIPILILILL